MPALERGDLLDERLFGQLNQSLALQQRLRTLGHDLNFAFNLYPAQLTKGTLAPQVRELLTEYSGCGSSLTFVLTEIGPLEALETSRECLLNLRMMGCRLSTHDFGTDSFSLQRLFQLPFNEIKRNAGVLQALTYELPYHAVDSRARALGDALGKSIFFEGIETEKLRRHLLSMGCTQGKGCW